MASICVIKSLLIFQQNNSVGTLKYCFNETQNICKKGQTDGQVNVSNFKLKNVVYLDL